MGMGARGPAGQHLHRAAREMVSCIGVRCCPKPVYIRPLQLVLQMGDMLGGGEQGQRGAKILLGLQWDEAEKQGCGKGEEKTRYTGDLGFHQREIPPEPTARQAALLWPLRSTLDFFCPELGLL